MPNICDFVMKVIGQEKDIDEFVLLRNYDTPNHFYRIFDLDEQSRDTLDDGRVAVVFDGSCAWSVHSCCIEGYPNEDLFALHSKRLSLEIEVYSTEMGMAFAEHYLYKYGECIVDEVEDYCAFYWDRDSYPDIKDAIKDGEIPEDLTEKDFDDDDGYHIEGGFGNWDWQIQFTR